LTAALLAIGATASSPAHASRQSVLNSDSDASSKIEGLWWFMLVASLFVLAVVTALLLLAVLRRRGRLGDRASRSLGRPALIAVGGVAVPFAILVVLFALTLDTAGSTSPTNLTPRMTIDVTGRQFFWEVQYPDAGAVTANEIHIPVGVPVAIKLRTKDVLHSFWVPGLNRKMDAIPGRTNELDLKANRPTVLRGQCAEFCGQQHANMAFLLVAEEPARFEAWLKGQAAGAATPATASAREGEQVFMRSGCAACHTLRGTQATGNVGPDLTHLGSRSTIAAVTLNNNRGNLGGWVLDPQHVKPGVKMPGTNISGPDLQKLLDFLESLK
jgi:cytochrome c oxidase subunit 2